MLRGSASRYRRPSARWLGLFVVGLLLAARPLPAQQATVPPLEARSPTDYCAIEALPEVPAAEDAAGSPPIGPACGRDGGISLDPPQAEPAEHPE